MAGYRNPDSVEGQLVGRDMRFCIIAARFNEAIVSRLVDGAVDTLRRHGVEEAHIQVVRVPGAWELPLTAQRIAKSRRVDGIVALGAVIRGATPHFEYVCGECASGLTRVSLDHSMPIGFGVLTCDSVEQAIERSGTKAGNKGSEAALSAIEMVSLLEQIRDKTMGGRHGARRLLVQALYQHQVGGHEHDELLGQFSARRAYENVDGEYFSRVLAAVLQDTHRLDEQIAVAADRPVAQLDPVEHAVLWIGLAELSECHDVPATVVINEAVELAREFGGADSYRYVNAVLDRVAGDARSA